MNIVCQLLEVNVTSYGLSAGSEFLSYLLFRKTIELKRDYTIICHSRYDEQKRCDWTHTDSSLNSKDMKNWDSLCNQNTLHFYWCTKEQNPYHFKNGKNLYLDDLEIDDATSCSNPLYKATCANHMTLNDSIYFAKNIISLIGDQIYGS
jgi:hypothetical protein